MGLISDLIDRAKSMLDVAKPAETNAIVSNYFDRRDWQDIRSRSGAIDAQLTELGKTVDYVEDFGQDLHSALFKVDPMVREAASMADSHTLNRNVIEQVLNLPEVQHLRSYTAGDAYCSAVGMGGITDKVVETLVGVREASAEAEARRDEAQKRADQAAQDLADAVAAAEADPNEADAEIIEAILDGCGALQQAAQQAQQEATAAGEAAISSGRGQIRKAASQAAEDLDEEMALQDAFGIEPGTLKHMSVQERLELARKLRGSRLAAFAKLLGRFRNVQQAESRKRVTNAASEVHGVTFSDDITRVVAGELLNLADPSLETLMWARFASGQLLTYDVRGKEKMGQGPIVVVCDESGSMDIEMEGLGGTREAWSKALSLALLEQARHRGRDFFYIGFSSAGQVHVVKILNGEYTVDKVIAFTEHFFSGGTHYEGPLNTALDLIEEHYALDGNERPDIVFISDDAYRAMDESFMTNWLRVKDKLSLVCYGIALGASYSGAMAQVADNVRSITDLTADPREVGDLFRTI